MLSSSFRRPAVLDHFSPGTKKTSHLWEVSDLFCIASPRSLRASHVGPAPPKEERKDRNEYEALHESTQASTGARLGLDLGRQTQYQDRQQRRRRQCRGR